MTSHECLDEAMRQGRINALRKQWLEPQQIQHFPHASFNHTEPLKKDDALTQETVAKAYSERFVYGNRTSMKRADTLGFKTFKTSNMMDSNSPSGIYKGGALLMEASKEAEKHNFSVKAMAENAEKLDHLVSGTSMNSATTFAPLGSTMKFKK